MDRNDSNAERIVAVFGGTGFLGRRIVQRLLEKAFRVRAVSRHPHRTTAKSAANSSTAAEPVRADMLDPSSIASAVARSYAVVNAVSLYVEHGDVTFERMHVEAAADLARAAREAGAEGFVQVSGIGSDPGSHSDYIGARGRGEDAVRHAFPGAIIVRSAVMTGADDALLTTLVKLLRLMPIYPLFGAGETRLQPVYVEDVAEAVSRLVGSKHDRTTFELGGPRVLSYKQLVQEVAASLDTRPMLVPVPFGLWSCLAAVAEFVPGAPITRNQVDLMRLDNIVAAEMPGLEELAIEPRDIKEIIGMIKRAGG
ncbi:complex I NDUFA9 subunit family protein [Mesorhizobium sp. M0488]|uniref:complex I NDUFA9 subunit family protein n=1 Tax=unclassified Mesorhizobium TaxID=325217 RepID=UPI00333D6D23